VADLNRSPSKTNNPMKSLLTTFILAISLFASVASAKIVQIAPGLSLDTAGEDATFQEVPDIGKEKYLCLWAGDAHLAFVVSMHEAYDKDLKSFLAHTERGMKAEGAKGIKMGEAVVIKNTRDADIRRYDFRYKSQGVDIKQIYYVVKSDSGYYSVIVTLLDPAAYDAVRARTDKLMSASSLNSALIQK
jgi:hypothetical protein